VQRQVEDGLARRGHAYGFRASSYN
jgi:hypothetical protein